MQVILQVALCYLVVVNAYLSPIISTKKQSRHSTELYAGKHHARFGNFLELVPRPKRPEMEELYSKLDIKEGTAEEMMTGDDLRKSRTRNLKQAVFEFPVVLPPPIVISGKWSEEEISVAMECLNLSYGKKKREELTDSERVGVIDWNEFDKHAINLIANYEIPLTKKKVTTWIQFHIKKRDVRFVTDTWMWSPDRPGRKRLPKVKVPKVKVLVNEE
jgi:hypothetical protein